MDLIIGLASIGIALWISIALLKFLFVTSKKIIGWLGPYIVAVMPSAMMYLFTTNIFGWGTSNASLTGLITAITIGTVMNASV
jgi:hypothetical protein